MHKNKIVNNYDEIYSLYIGHVEKPSSWNNVYERPNLTALLPKELKDLDVLDVGCGAGYYTAYALEKGARVTALDQSAAMLEHTRKICPAKKPVTIQADLSEGLPMVADASQDLIIASLVLHYIADWQTILKEFHRVMRFGAMVVISTHHPLGDYFTLEKEDYFDSKQVTDHWGDKDYEFPVTYFTRTLEELLNPILDSQLSLTSIHEPQPNEDCRLHNPRAYKMLSTRPAFLFLTLGKFPIPSKKSE